MADAQKLKLDTFSPVPAADASYTRRLNRLFGEQSLIGKSVRLLMTMSGIGKTKNCHGDTLENGQAAGAAEEGGVI